MTKKNKLIFYYLIVLLGVVFTIIGFFLANEFLETVYTLDEVVRQRIFLYVGLSLLFLFNGGRILNKFYKDKIKGK